MCHVRGIVVVSKSLYVVDEVEEVLSKKVLLKME